MELLADEADILEVRGAVDLSVSPLFKYEIRFATSIILTCCTINVFKSTDRSMKLVLDTMVYSFYVTSLDAACKVSAGRSLAYAVAQGSGMCGWAGCCCILERIGPRILL